MFIKKGHSMKVISKTILKSKISDYLKQVEITGEEIIITDHNIPVMKIIPLKQKQSLKKQFEQFQGKAKYYAPAIDSEIDE